MLFSARNHLLDLPSPLILLQQLLQGVSVRYESNWKVAHTEFGLIMHICLTKRLMLFLLKLVLNAWHRLYYTQTQ